MRRSWEIERKRAVFSSSLRRSASASTISACILSRSRESSADSASARSASSRRRSASTAWARASPATALLARATIAKVISATQFCSAAIVKRCSGGMWKKLKATALAREASRPRRSPQTIEINRIAGM